MFGYTSSAQNGQLRGLPFIKNYGKQEYRGGIQNWEITQDKNGILYVANNFGLLEFDGSSWSLYQVSNNSKLRSIHVVESGHIYVGSQADFGYFFPDARGRLQYTSLADSLNATFRNFDEAWKVYEIDGDLYFCTFKNIYKYDGEQLEVIGSDFNLEISYLVEDQLYVQEWQKGLSHLKNNMLELIPSGQFFRDKRISGIIPLENGKLLISTFDHGFYTYESGQITPYQIKGHPKLQRVNTVSRLRNGKIAIGTQNNGLLIIDKDGNLELKLDKNSGLIDRTINTIYEDRSGSLWLGMNFGLSRIELNSPFSVIDERMGVSGAGYAAFMDNDRVYLGTNTGLHAYKREDFHNLGFGQNASFIQGSEGQVYSVQRHHNQMILGHHNGAFVINNSRVNPINNEKGAWLFVQIPDHPQYYIQGSYLGLNLYRAVGRDLVIQHKIDGFLESSRVMGFDDQNNLWVTQGYKGAYKLKLSSDLKTFEKVEYYNQESGFPSNILINVFAVKNELIFSSEKGFYSYNQSSNRFEPNAQFNELIGPESSLIDMREDEMGNIYFIDQNKIGKLTPTTFEAYNVETSVFNRISGILNDDLGNINVLDYQNVLFGSSQGFIHYNPMYRFETAQDFKILLRNVQTLEGSDSTYFQGKYVSDGKILSEQPESQVLRLPFSQNAIRFTYSAVDFISEDKMRYRYRLEGFNDQWSDWVATVDKEYTNLPEGDYTFQVQARNVYDHESNIETYKFSIAPPFYRSNLAYGVYIVGGLSLLFLGFTLLDKKYQREKVILAAQKKEELDQKNSEIQSITEKSEKEIIQLKNENLQAEIEHKNNELTSSAMHLIQKNQLLNNIKNTLVNLTKEQQPQAVNGELNRIVKSISKDLSNAEDWKTFELNFDKVHGNFITRFKESFPDLTPQELKLSAYLRMNLNTKEMANLLNISVRGVEIGRYRVRKKLQLERSDNLTDFILRF